MSYIDAGYAAAIGVLFCYSVSLFYRRGRLARLAEKVADRQTRQDG